MLVVHRVEGAGGEEREVAPVQGEHRLGVGEAQRRRVVHHAVGRSRELDLGQVVPVGVRPRQPRRVRGEDQALDGAVLCGGQLARRAAGRVDQQQAPVVGGDRDARAVGGGGQPDHPAQLSGGHAAAARAVPVGHDEAVLAAGVVDPHHLRAQQARQPGADPGAGGQGAHRTVGVGHPLHAAAHLHRAGPAVGGHGHVAQVLAGRDRRCGAGRARAAGADLQTPRHRVGREVVEHPELTGDGVDHPGAVGAGVPGVEVRVVGVPAQVGTVGPHRVHVAHALVVGQERHPPVRPHRGGQLRGEPGQQPHELPVAGGVHPEPARGAPAVALPHPGVAATAAEAGAEHGRAGGGDVQRGDGPVRQAHRRTPVQGHRARPGLVAEGLAPGGGHVHVGVVGPAEHAGPGVTPPRGAHALPALRRHHVQLRGTVALAQVGEVGAVGGEAQVLGGRGVGGELPGTAPGQRCEPDVVVGEEADEVAVQRGVVQVGVVRRAQHTGHPRHDRAGSAGRGRQLLTPTRPATR